MKVAYGFALGAAFLLSGCAVLPGAGPATMEIVGSADAARVGFELVEVDRAVLSVVGSASDQSLAGSFGASGRPGQPTIGVGDTVAVTIWEAGFGGLFSAPLSSERFTPGSRTATIPEQPVGADGAITVPYAGRVRVAGLTPPEVERAITQRLEGRAIQPQVLVSVVRPVTSTATVGGEVAAGARVPLTGTERILDVIALAGGPRVPVSEATVRLSRGGRTVGVPLRTIVSRPSENVYVRPGDVVTVVRDPQVFFAAGATGANAEIPFGADAISVQQAIAKAGGLIDSRADPAGVFVLRFEPAEVARQLVPDSPLLEGEAYVPIVYRLNMRDPQAVFLASSMQMRDRDVLYVSNAALSDLSKVTQLFTTVAAPVATGVGIANAVN